MMPKCKKISLSKSKMKLHKFPRVLVLVSIYSFVVTCQVNQVSYAQAAPKKTPLTVEAQLNPEQVRLLRALGLKIAVPNYVPPGFRLDKVQAEVEQNARFGGIGYTLFYRRYDANSSKDFCFAIEATSGGIGDLPEGDRSYPIKSPLFGKTTLEYGKYGQTSNPTFLSNWLGEEKGPFYRFTGTGVTPGLSNCNNINAQEAVRVTESLGYLNP